MPGMLYTVHWSTYLLCQPVLLPDREVPGRGVHMAAHVLGNGHFLVIVLAPVHDDEEGEDGREEGCLQDCFTDFLVLFLPRDGIAAQETFQKVTYIVNEELK